LARQIESNKSITILKELRDYIIPLGDEELFQLERNILKDGCREPLIVWKKTPGQMVLIDGHNRYKICEKHNISFKVKEVSFKDVDEARIWMVENQMGRRNLTPDQMSYCRGLKYLALKNKKGGYENVKSKGQIDTSTSEALSAHFNISESTIKRDARFAQGLEIVGRSNPKLKMKILTGEAKVKKADVQCLSHAKNAETMIVKNEADLYNKAKLIHDQELNDLELKLKNLKDTSKKNAEDSLKSLEPVFTNKEDRLKNIKAMILSATNEAIREKNVDSIRKLKKLVDKLANELL
jgi:hypothetical protein